MSQHEVEAVVERAIRLLAKSDVPRSHLRSCYAALFDFQGCFDTGFTHFRVMPELLAAGFVYRIEPAQHPDFERAHSYFASLPDRGRLAVPGSEPDGGYFYEPYLYFDAGSPLWQRLVQLGALRGDDAQPPRALRLQDVMLDVVRLAERADDVPLVACCYRLLVWGLALTAELGEGLRDDAAVLELRRIVKRTNALELRFSEATLRDDEPSPEVVAEMPILPWWFDVSDAVPLS